MTMATLMSRTADLCGRFRRDERGSTAVEYTLIAAGIAGAIIIAVMTLGTSVKTKLYDGLGSAL